MRGNPVVSVGLIAGILMGAGAAAAQSAAPASAAPADDGNWVMPAKNYASTRFSELDQINTRTVAGLRVQFTFSTGLVRGHEAAPLVADGTMYIVTPFPNYVYALDLTKPGAPIKWKHEPKPASAAQGVACCDFVNRGAALSDGRLFFNTLDNQTVALDAASGAELWLTALDAASGKIAWRAWHTGPDADVLIGPDYKPFYDKEKGKDLGVTTWPPNQWEIGGGTAWGWISYDPDLNLIYYGTANPGPWNPEQRPGDNKWTGGIFARDPDTGQARWFYQVVPHDLYDHDGINELILLDMPVDGPVEGRTRKVLVRPERNGYVYVIDRTSGEVLSADPFAYINSTSGVDLKTGDIHYVEAKQPVMGKVVRDICPTAPGAKDWNPSAFSPRTGLIYIPHMNICMDWESQEANYIAGTPYVGANVRMFAGPGGNRGELSAWDPVKRAKAWSIKEDLPLWSATLATAGDVVFYGTMDGWFKAVDATSGAELWRFKTGSGIIGQPVTYRGPDGRQYVAVLSGVGGWAGAVVVGDLDTRDPTAAKGFAGVVPDLKERTAKGGMLYVFALP